MLKLNHIRNLCETYSTKLRQSVVKYSPNQQENDKIVKITHYNDRSIVLTVYKNPIQHSLNNETKKKKRERILVDEQEEEGGQGMLGGYESERMSGKGSRGERKQRRVTCLPILWLFSPTSFHLAFLPSLPLLPSLLLMDRSEIRGPEWELSGKRKVDLSILK